ncbi:hypothetical protein R1flu_022853 [Riccia fluitans]|uniref:F-box domain-containing protein n=1 Tax=Riccia fluitans TaxID=41844 RepID=A0ABD1XTC3_9MARC
MEWNCLRYEILQALVTLIREQPVEEMQSTKALQALVRRLGRFVGNEDGFEHVMKDEFMEEDSEQVTCQGNMDQLPSMILLNVLAKADAKDCVRAACVDRKWHQSVEEDCLWEEFCLCDFALPSAIDDSGNKTSSYKADRTAEGGIT